MSLIVYIFSVFFPCRRSSSALRVRSAGHALNLNKGCTKRQSLPNCQQNGRPGRNIAPESRMQGVILSETARRPSCGRRRLFRGKADRRNRCGTTRQAAPADTQAGIPRIQKPWSGPNGNGKRCGGGRRGTGDGQQTASAGRWTAQRATDNRRRGDGRRWTAMDGGRKK